MVNFLHRFWTAVRGTAALGLAVVTSASLQPVVVAEAQDRFDLQDLWHAPTSRPVTPPLGNAVSLLQAGRPADALPFLRDPGIPPALAGYARLYEGRALAKLGQYAGARGAAQQLLAANPTGALRESAWWLVVEAAEGAARWTDAIQALERLAAIDTADRAEVHLRLGRAAEKAGNRAGAISAYDRVYYQFPLLAQAAAADKALVALGAPARPTDADWARTVERAERLFSARRYADAQRAYLAVRGHATDEVRRQVDLRLAQSAYHLRRHTAARPALAALVSTGPADDIRREAEYYLLSTERVLGRTLDYLRMVDEFVERHAGHRLAETTLNDLGTHYILADDDGRAAEVFRDLYGRYPTGAFADRAAWKAGWWSYKQGDYPETIRLFESAAVGLRRADYRPAWLYWAARSHARLGARDQAIDGFRKTIADYRNSYYGREAARELAALQPVARIAAVQSPMHPGPIDPGPPPVNARLVEALLSAGLDDDAVREIRASQRAFGSSSRLEATLAYALNQLGQLRPAITLMRRAYPQFMASGGEALPREILTVIFPVEYRDLIHRYADAHRLDPFLMTALIAQESTFQADVRSSADAWGLMQIIPGTGQRYARTLGIRPFSTRRLTEPETNVRIGMRYFADLLQEFGGPAPALAAYNAGERRVRIWLSARPDMARDEFIDDIPFPETQNYVKRVLGTAEDYRLLYGTAAAGATVPER
ncbi:MAG TPA: transglycosylase SLT domain-containing protein [Vicinamibacterales bacterium]|nr:transglycosylase SLT domain-containing protein [Vicinamibacterales bacterium]